MKIKRLLTSFILSLGLSLALLWLLTAEPMTRVYADTYIVTNIAASGPGSLRQAILDANGNPGHDTIDFGVSGTIVLTDALPAIIDTLTISGPGAEQLSISGDNAYRVFSITSGVAVTITAVTVRDGNANNGGGIWSAGTLQLNSARIVGSSASKFGGGVYVGQSSATLSGTQVVSNSASWGGGVFVDYGSSATLNGTQVVSNSASDSGGGVYVGYGSSATLNETQVVSNSASDSGGGVYVVYGSATLSGTQVVSNSASQHGGGVFIYHGSATLSGTQVVSNSAPFGGGVCVDQGSATLSGTQVVSNSASSIGGGVYVGHGSATLNVSGGEVGSNSAQWGGGVYVDSGSSAMLNGMQIGSNSASKFGGGVYVWNGSATLSGTQITANDATAGSALYTKGTITPTTALTITGDIYQTGGRFAGSSHDLRIAGSLNLAGGDFYAPDAPHNFVLTGSFTHTGGVYHQTQVVTGSSDVGFPKAGGVILNANGQDLGSTEAALTAGADCAGLTAGEAVRHCYVITPTNTSGRDAAITFFYRDSELLPGHACAVMESYRWTGAWDTPLTRDAGYGSAGRLCGPDPQSLRVTGVSTFSLFVLRGRFADVRISKVVTPAIAALGQTITYTLAFSNAGLITATGVVITDSIPVSVTHSSLNVDSDVAITATGNISYVWKVVDLAPGAGGVITVTGVLSHPLAGGVFTNTAVITTTAIDSDAGNNNSSAEVTVLAPDLTVAKSVTPTIAALGDTITYNLVISNAGSAAASGVKMTDTLPPGVSFGNWVITGSAQLLPPGKTITWGAWDVPTNTEYSFSFTAIVTDNAAFAGQTITNTAYVTAANIASDSDDAIFAITADTYTLTVSTDGTGSGTVSSTPAGINCGPACQAGFTDGTVVTLTAAAGGGSTFAGWSGEGCSGTGDCTVTMTTTRQVTATFNVVAGQPGYGSTPAPGSAIDVGTASVGSTVSATLTISETGEATLVVTPTLSGADAAAFGFAPTTLAILDGGAAQDLTISCTPSFTGALVGTLVKTLTATLTVEHNAPDSPAVYPLTCTIEAQEEYYIYLPLVLRD